MKGIERSAVFDRKVTALTLAILSAPWVPLSASAQTNPLAETRLPQLWVDENSIELTTGQFQLQLPLVSFGEGIALRTGLDWKYPAFESFFGGFVGVVRTSADVIHRGDSEQGYEYKSIATPSGTALWNNFGAVHPTGTGFYYKSPAGGAFNVPYYTSSNANAGSQVGFVNADGNTITYDFSGIPQLHSYTIYTMANGEQWRALIQRAPLSPCTGCARIRNVTSSRGFFIQYEYQREAAPTSQSQVLSWNTVTRMSGASLAHVYCDTSSMGLCQNALNEGNSVTFDYSDGLTITHASGTVTKYRLNGSGALEVTSPGTNGSLTATARYGSCGQAGDFNHVHQLTSAGGTWTYDYTCLEGEQTNDWFLNRTNPQGGQLTARGTTRDSVPELMQDELLRLNWFGANRDWGYHGLTVPEGGGPYLARDARNNVIEAGRYAKDNVTKLVTYRASFPATCSNFKTCNRPTWTKDGNNNQTDYTYDSQHGGVLTVTEPAAANGIRPQTRYEYEQRYPWLKNSSGGYSQAASPIWVRTKEERCISTAATSGNCTGGTADEVVTTFDYGPGNAPNNLLVRGVVVTANGQSLRTCFWYDRMGRKVSETRPNANLSSCP